MTREAIIAEMSEVRRDLDAIVRARSDIEARIQEMEGSPRQEIFKSWAVTHLIINSLIVARVRCEGLIEDYGKALEDMDTPDNVISLVRKGDQSCQ